ncbi:DUF6193 family natural product biosynthesis protein [Streptomyces sp. PCS3-D2]|uniref:DUF6193 family natural product biosynthesis protein n=1 Tax=Streptomyces sp. PCS3-D2 TaxID=1460244 RepID=UPI00272B4FDF|nr:DUF6193 family natural product biosynthesis protein [Streptomyces sp. PCS3-D2]WKV75421.1 DUF6193 family natural product biosynthesis protein [Streptomyces sp. PCS3-D2]
MIDAVRCLVDNGIKWRAMPADFPGWDRVYAFWRRWRDKGLRVGIGAALALPDRVREAAGRDREPTAGVIDAQSVKGASSVPAAARGFDGGKKVNGRKRHIVVDTLGLLLAVIVAAASVTDREAGQTLLARLSGRHWRVARVWADGGYTGKLVDVARSVLRIALTVVKRSDGTAGFVVLPKRWLLDPTRLVESEWQHLRTEARELECPWRPAYRALVEAAHAEPALRRLYPFTSHWALRFSTTTRPRLCVVGPLLVTHDVDRYTVDMTVASGDGTEYTTAPELVAAAVRTLPSVLTPVTLGR